MDNMKRGLLVVAALVLVVAPLVVAAADNADVAGTWTLSWQGRQGMRTATVVFEQDGEALSGNFSGPSGREIPLTGSVKGNDITFSVTMSTQRGEFTLDYEGTVDGDSMKGTVAVGEHSIEWTGKRGE